MSDIGLTHPLLPNDNSVLTPSISVASVGAIRAACVACGPDGRISDEFDAHASVRRLGTYVDAEGEPKVSASGPCVIVFGNINAVAALVLLGIMNIPRLGSKVDAEGKPDAVGGSIRDIYVVPTGRRPVRHAAQTCRGKRQAYGHGLC